MIALLAILVLSTISEMPEHSLDLNQCELTQLISPDGSDEQRFGLQVGMDNDRIVVGDTAGQGSVYVYRRNPAWEFEEKVIGIGTGFGKSVAISGDTLAVGVPWDCTIGAYAGAVIIYNYDDGWEETARLFPSDESSYSYFGCSIGIQEDLMVVGAWLDSEFANNGGSAYVFRQQNGLWEQEAKLIPDDLRPTHFFGFEVALDNEILVISAHGDNSIGAAYVYGYDSEWYQMDKLIGHDVSQDDSFGCRLDISGDVIVIGSAWDNNDSGSAYVFRYNGNSWAEEIKLIPDDSAANDLFGYSVQAGTDIVAIGAPWDDNEHGGNAGAVYVYEYNNGWIGRKLNSADNAGGDFLGYDIAMNGSFITASSPWNNTPAGINSGSVYVFDSFNTHSKCCSDLDEDDDVDVADLAILISACGSQGENLLGDLDRDGDVDSDDLTILLTNFDCGCNHP